MKWEYSVASFNLNLNPRELGQALSRIGESGWELVSVVFNPGVHEMVYYFKRLADKKPR